jgi:polyisoprenoid-binding protein YceI
MAATSFSVLSAAFVTTALRAEITGASESRVAFDAAGPAGFKIEGTTPDLTISETNGNVLITVGLAKLTTGIELRDHHMREKYLEVGKFPTTVLSVARSALKLPGVGAQIDADVPGQLTLHGQTRAVTVHYSAKGDGATFPTQGRFRINMNDFGIIVPSYLGVTVKPDIDVNASFRVAGS